MGVKKMRKPRTSSGSRSLGSRGSRCSRGESTGGSTESSSGSRAEASILKHATWKKWPQLRDRPFVSPDASTDVSSPTHYNSPASDMNDPTSITVSDSREILIMPDGILDPSTRSVKECLIEIGQKGSTKHLDGFLSKPTG